MKQSKSNVAAVRKQMNSRFQSFSRDFILIISTNLSLLRPTHMPRWIQSNRYQVLPEHQKSPPLTTRRAPCCQEQKCEHLRSWPKLSMLMKYDARRKCEKKNGRSNN